MGQPVLLESFEAMMRDSVPIDERLIITPLLSPQKQIGPGSIDLRLGSEFLEASRRELKFIDPLKRGRGRRSQLIDFQNQSKTYVPLGRPFTLHPGQFVLGATLEFLSIPTHVVGQVVSRSSWGRLGLLVATAVAVQPGFRGVLTLELVNTGSVPIVLRPGLRVAQLQLWTADSPTARPYGSGDDKYPVPLGPEAQKLAWETSESKKLRRISDLMHGRVARAGWPGNVGDGDDDGSA